MRKKSKPPNLCVLATVPFSSLRHADYLPIPFLVTMCILAQICLPTYLLTYGLSIPPMVPLQYLRLSVSLLLATVSIAH